MLYWNTIFWKLPLNWITVVNIIFIVQRYRQCNNHLLFSFKVVKFSFSMVSGLSTTLDTLDLILLLCPPFFAVNWWLSSSFELTVSDNNVRSSVVLLEGSVNVSSSGSLSTPIFVAATFSFASVSFVAFSWFSFATASIALWTSWSTNSYKKRKCKFLKGSLEQACLTQRKFNCEVLTLGKKCRLLC